MRADNRIQAVPAGRIPELEVDRDDFRTPALDQLQQLRATVRRSDDLDVRKAIQRAPEALEDESVAISNQDLHSDVPPCALHLDLAGHPCPAEATIREVERGSNRPLAQETFMPMNDLASPDIAGTAPASRRPERRRVPRRPTTHVRTWVMAAASLGLIVTLLVSATNVVS